MKKPFLLVVAFLVYFHSLSQNWGLDQDFNGVGYNATNMIVGGDDNAECLTIQNDGKILVAGYGLRVARYNTDGTLDTSFNTIGSTAPFGNNGSLNFIKQIIITPSNKILVVGGIYTNKFYLYLAQYNLNGTLDTTFGTNGRKNIDVGPSVTLTIGNAIYTSDNMILVATTSYLTEGDFNIIKCNKFGILEPSFGGTGIVSIDGISNDQEGRIALRSDGKILLSGNSNANPAIGTFRQHVLMLFNQVGTLDTTFGTNGKSFTNFATNNSQEIRSILLLNDDSLLISGHYYTGNASRNDGFVSKLNSDGTIDSSFGENGISLVSFTDANSSIGNNDFINAATIQSDGKIVIAGLSNGSGSDFKFCVARFNPQGTIDTTFGTDGKMLFPIYGFNDAVMDVKSQSDGKIVVCGLSKINTVDCSYIVARLTPNSTLSSSELNTIQNSIQLYPNPAKDKITISGLNFQFSNEKLNATLMSSDGKELKSLNYTTTVDSIELCLNDISSGIYLLRISDGNKDVFRKFVKE